MHELCYATSDSPEGPFTYGGVIVSNCDLHIDSYKKADMAMASGANNHGSMVQIGDSWYIFYHRHTNNTWYSRQGCAEKLAFRPDGSIIQAEITSCGLNNGPLSDIGEYPSYIACNLFTEEHSIYVGSAGPRVVQDGGDQDPEIGYIRQLGNNSTAGFKYFDMKNVTGLSIKTRGYFNGKVQVKTTWDGEVLGEIDVNSQNIWTSGSCTFAPISGVHALYLTFVGNGSCSLKSFELLH
jgi:hypothetical protein